MTRDEFVQALVQAVIEGWLTEDQGKDLLALFDEGKLPKERSPLGLQRLLARGEAEDDKIRNLMLLALLGLLGLQNALREEKGTLDLVAELVKRMGTRQRISLLDMSQTQFEEAMRELAWQLEQGRAQGGIDLETWMGETDGVVRRQIYLAHMLAAGAMVSGTAEIARLQRSMAIQSAYLARFGDQIALYALMGQPMSTAQIGARASLYAGEARGIFFQTAEENDTEHSGPGWVEEYIAQDDDHTCGPCSEAQGYYLPGQGPMPGRVCRGGTKCRCRRESFYNPQVWDELAAQDPNWTG